MTLVDTHNGEITEIADRDEAVRLAAEISGAIAHMNLRTGKAIEAMIDGYKARIWIALGMGSWEELVEAKNWKWKPTTTEDRAAFGEVFRTNGMSFRSIGRLMGASPSTIHADLSGVRNRTPDEIQGADGKSYPATKPEPVASVDPSPAVDVETPAPMEVVGETTTSDVVEGVASTPVDDGAAVPPIAPSVEDVADAVLGPDVEGDAIKYARAWMRAANIGDITTFDAEHLAEVATLVPHLELDQQVETLAQVVHQFSESFRRARKPGLTVITGGQS